MGFDRTLLPDPPTFYENTGLRLAGRGKWRTTACAFHDGSDSMRINLQTGAFVCMAGCGARGGDVLAYHMALTGLEFVEAAKALGAWRADGTAAPARPAPLSPRAALEVLQFEAIFMHRLAPVARVLDLALCELIAQRRQRDELSHGL